MPEIWTEHEARQFLQGWFAAKRGEWSEHNEAAWIDGYLFRAHIAEISAKTDGIYP